MVLSPRYSISLSGMEGKEKGTMLNEPAVVFPAIIAGVIFGAIGWFLTDGSIIAIAVLALMGTAAVGKYCYWLLKKLLRLRWEAESSQQKYRDWCNIASVHAPVGFTSWAFLV